MLLRLQPYDLNVTYKPGTEIPMGDALSRAHLPDAVPDIEPVIVNMINFIAVTPTRYKQFHECRADELNELHAMILPEGLARYKAGDTARNQNVLGNT